MTTTVDPWSTRRAGPGLWLITRPAGTERAVAIVKDGLKRHGARPGPDLRARQGEEPRNPDLPGPREEHGAGDHRSEQCEGRGQGGDTAPPGGGVQVAARVPGRRLARRARGRRLRRRRATEAGPRPLRSRRPAPPEPGPGVQTRRSQGSAISPPLA